MPARVSQLKDSGEVTIGYVHPESTWIVGYGLDGGVGVLAVKCSIDDDMATVGVVRDVPPNATTRELTHFLSDSSVVVLDVIEPGETCSVITSGMEDDTIRLHVTQLPEYEQPRALQ